ncbi:MAG: isochorismate synthase [Verrucomicrobia bacterium]|nr:isochorismate synthase [Verrucomicrobiota bacterium]
MVSQTPSTAQRQTDGMRDSLRQDMARQIARSGVATNGDDGIVGFRRVAVPLVGVDVLAWLNLQQSASKIYWGARDCRFEVAGIGVAHRLTGSASVDSRTLVDRIGAHIDQSDNGLRYYGGWRFYEALDDHADWDAFPAASFIVPQFELTRDGADTELVCNIPNAADESAIEGILAHLGDLIFDLALPEDPFPAPHSRVDTPNRDAWTRNVTTAVDALVAGGLDKVVLARRTNLAFDETLSPVALLRRLKAVTPDCFHFCFQPDPRSAFVGASPERLYRRDGRHLETEAVAGTRPRGGTVASDRELGESLLGSDKDLREHVYVRDAIQQALDPVCRDLEIDAQPRLLKLARGQHLFTGVKGTLGPRVHDAALLRLLHPTPAVGGCPREAALTHIRASEGFDRGWYAAPVGWIGRDAAEFAVAIRSALVRDSHLSLFSGAGIVQGSTPDDEWEEIENKIEDFIRILTGSRTTSG